MVSKKKASPAIDQAVVQSVNFELSIADLARRSERRAWGVAFTAVALALILAAGWFYMLPLKQKVPYLVMADAYTGTATVARLNGDFAMRGMTTREAINRSNVAHFVLARESYDLALVNLRDWTTVQTMAAAGVKASYVNQFSSTKPDSLIKQYGKDQAIRVKLLSIVLIGGGPGVTPRGATVRFQRSHYHKQTGASRVLDNKIATIEFTYKQNLQMDDQARIENPLGFWVTSYRVDDDYSSAPPVPPPGNATAAPVAVEVAPQSGFLAAPATAPALATAANPFNTGVAQ